MPKEIRTKPKREKNASRITRPTYRALAAFYSIAKATYLSAGLRELSSFRVDPVGRKTIATLKFAAGRGKKKRSPIVTILSDVFAELIKK
ncbi:hypothetical protein Trydic_g3873 [Trypoxylus dichotomus]